MLIGLTLFGIVIFKKVSKVVQETKEVMVSESRCQHKQKYQRNGKSSFEILGNKEELFSFLTNTLSRVAMPEGKSIFVTAG